MKYFLIDTKNIDGKYWTAWRSTTWRSTGSKVKYFLAPSTVDPNSTFGDEKVRDFEKLYRVHSIILFEMNFI